MNDRPPSADKLTDIRVGSFQFRPHLMKKRFRGFLPVAVDVETGGFNPRTDALLELAGLWFYFDDRQNLQVDEPVNYHIKPFPNANMEPASMAVNGIDPHHPLRIAVGEVEALTDFFRRVRSALKESECTRAILVGHNAAFDLAFLNAAVERCGIKRNPFHPFCTFDTATLGGVAYGQTVLSRAVQAAAMPWDDSSAHSAVYDAQMSARLFCSVVNAFRDVYERQAALVSGTST